MDQTIEKVSFCAPDRNFDKAFSYICRDGTTRRWICHGFLALKDSVSAGFPPCHKGWRVCCPGGRVELRRSCPLPGGWPGCPASPSWIGEGLADCRALSRR